jgi:hypothetical protein
MTRRRPVPPRTPPPPPRTVVCARCGAPVVGVRLRTGVAYQCWPACGASWFAGTAPPPAPPRRTDVPDEPAGWWDR